MAIKFIINTVIIVVVALSLSSCDYYAQYQTAGIFLIIIQLILFRPIIEALPKIKRQNCYGIGALQVKVTKIPSVKGKHYILIGKKLWLLRKNFQKNLVKNGDYLLRKN